MENLSSFILEKTGVNLDIRFDNDTLYSTPTSRLRLLSMTGTSIQFLGYGWSKLGFELNKLFIFINNTLDGSFLPDFG
jgi:hypothetical protein